MQDLALYHERLRAMASAILRDDHGAEDTVQETWIRALGHGPREPKALGAWLWTTARRVALNRRRGELRRGWRETEFARQEIETSSEELAQRVELQHQVSGVLQNLAEPHRSLLREHYIGGKTVAELAGHSGVSLSTQKERLRLARAHMRRALEREGIGTPGSAHWSILALALPKGQGPVWIGSLIAMKKFAVITVALAVASALLLWKAPWQTGSAGPGPLELAAEGSAPLASVESPGLSPRLQAPEAQQLELRSPLEEQPKVAAPLDWVVRGRSQWIDGAGGAFPRVHLHLTLQEGTEADGQVLDSIDLETGPDGAFEWALVDPGRTVSIAAVLDKVEGYNASVQERTIAFPDDGPPQGILVRLAPRDAWVEGTVRAGDSAVQPGLPIAGALVHFNGAQTHTDENGTYRLAVPSRGYGSVIVSAAGFRKGGLTPGNLVAGETTKIHIELEPELGIEGRLFGYVRDARGAVLAGAEVSCNVSREGSVLSDATGYYELSGVEWEPGIHVACKASHAGFAATEELIGLPPGESAPALGTQLDFVLVKGSRLEGRVTDSQGNSVQGARLWIGTNARLVANRKAYSDANGAFVFEHVAPGSMLLGARKRGQPEFLRRIEVPKTGEDLRMDVVLERGTPLVGQVLDPSGAAVAGATVTARRASNSPLAGGAGIGSSGRSDGSGRFSIEGVPSGDLNLRIRGEGIVWTELQLEHDGSEVQLVVKRASGIGGRVIDAKTGRPIETFRILLVHHGDDSLGPRVSGIDISWVMGGVAFSSPLGRWSNSPRDLFTGGVWTRVKVTAEGYQPLITDPLQIPIPGQPCDWVFELTPE